MMNYPSEEEFERDRRTLDVARDPLEGWDAVGDDDPDSDAKFAAMLPCHAPDLMRGR